MVNGRERDGIYVTEEAVHLLECTISRAKQKAVEDIEKSVKLSRELKREYPDKAVQCWFITADEPTAEQRTVASKIREVRVVAQSYDGFRSRLVNASSYLGLRKDYPFGSARNLGDGSLRIDRSEYIGLDLLRLSDSRLFSPKDVTNDLLFGSLKRVALLGDYGAGKSMTLRELYLSMVDTYREGRTLRFPVYINLRDHSGQQEPTEVLERHARRIGFDAPHHLVRAWRAGFINLILDGFDELSTTGWMAFNRRLKDIRFSTVEAVRRFIKETPPESPIVVAGRISYFEDEDECLHALGFSASTTSVLSLNDFTEPQIERYLARKGIHNALPAWLPSRPLLIGALAVRGALDGKLEANSDPGAGWDNLLQAVCERESTTHEVIDALAVRSIIEHLASTARAKGGLSAPLTLNDIVHAYTTSQGVEPDERAQALLLRLPGLGTASSGDGARAFIDLDFASAAAAGDVSRYVHDPFGISDAPARRASEVLQEVGVAVAVHQILRRKTPHELIHVGMRVAADSDNDRSPRHALVVDLVKILVAGSFEPPREPPRVVVSEVIVDELDLSGEVAGIAEVVFKDCLFSTLYMPESAALDAALPRMIGCEFDHIEGRGDEQRLDSAMFRGCVFRTFSAPLATNAAVMDARNLEPGVKALVTILRKLFLQKGAGRKQNAFYRGIGGASGVTTRIVDKVLDAVSSADFAQPTKGTSSDRVWHPNRRLAARAKMIVSNPKATQESLVSAVRHIS